MPEGGSRAWNVGMHNERACAFERPTRLHPNQLTYIETAKSFEARFTSLRHVKWLRPLRRKLVADQAEAQATAAQNA
jgi:hypothetical protein